MSPSGRPYEAAAVDAQLEKYQATLRARGFYEARATDSVDFVNGGAIVRVAIDRGPHVSVAFSGDPLPEAERDRLVPIRAEASADEDLLEDSSRAIEDYFHVRGYRDADVLYAREEAPGELTVRFTITRGPRYLVDDVTINGNTAVAADGADADRPAEGRRSVRAGDARRRRRRHSRPVSRARLHAGDGDADAWRCCLQEISRRRPPIGTCRSRSPSPRDLARWSAPSICRATWC